MSKEVQTIYLDEAGFTGNSMLDPAQPMFVYSGLALAQEQAAELHSEAIARFRLQGHELKGSNLVKRPRGRQAVSWLLSQSVEDCLVVVSDKRYALAGRFFEYLIEPPLADLSSVLYALEFQKFVAMVLYCHYAGGDSSAEALLKDFEQLMRTLDPEQVDAVVSHVGDVEPASYLGDILLFASSQQDRIKREIEFLRKIRSGPGWELELSMPSVNFLLASWGEKYKDKALEVHCDNSKPIQSDLSSSISIFNQMVGREDKFYIPVGRPGRPSIIYNLATEIILEDSVSSPGIQIADVIASSVAYALNNPQDDVSAEWLDQASEMVAETIAPDFDLIDLTLRGPMINSLVLGELKERSVKGEDLLFGLREFILTAMFEYPRLLKEDGSTFVDPSSL